MEIDIRSAQLGEYKIVETIMKQVQQMHIDWRPDIYKASETYHHTVQLTCLKMQLTAILLRWAFFLFMIQKNTGTGGENGTGYSG